MGLVVPGWVEGQLADDSAVVGEDPDVGAGDEHGDGSAGVSAAEADVVESALVADGDLAVAVDLVVAETVAVDGDAREAGMCFGAGVERVDGSAPREPDVDIQGTAPGVRPRLFTTWVTDRGFLHCDEGLAPPTDPGF